MKQELRILGVRIDKLSHDDMLAQIMKSIAQKKFCHIATINSAFLLLANRSKKYRDKLNKCELTVPDGSGVTIIARLLYQVPLTRYAGADILLDILMTAEQNQWSVGFVYDKFGLSNWKSIQVVLQEQYPQLNVCGVGVNSYDIKNDYKGDELKVDAKIIQFVEKYRPNIVIANFGAPTQEYILSQLHQYPVVAIGVGGAVDFLTGRVNRAPKWIQRIGCEWMWRTVQQPNRFGKMCASVLWFPTLALLERLSIMRNPRT